MASKRVQRTEAPPLPQTEMVKAEPMTREQGDRIEAKLDELLGQMPKRQTGTPAPFHVEQTQDVSDDG